MAAFKEAAREIWYGEDGLINGYVMHSTNLTRVVLTNAGHMSPGYHPVPSLLTLRDTPEAALEMMTNFIEGKAFRTKD
jgi:hypothetical protein